MLGSKDAMAAIAVKNIEVARKFHEEKLGLKPAGSAERGLLVYKSGNSTVLVYESQYAGTNKATTAARRNGNTLRH
jgi:hypothetical protein